MPTLFASLDPTLLSVIGNLIRRLNDALGATSILVTHDLQDISEDCELRVFHGERRDCRRKLRWGNQGEQAAVRTPVCVGRERRTGIVPLSGRSLPEGFEVGVSTCRIEKSILVCAALAAPWSMAWGAWGYASRFFLMTLIISGVSFRRIHLTIREIYFSRVMSLIIILVSGLLIGMILGLQGYEILQKYGSESALGAPVELSLVVLGLFYFNGIHVSGCVGL